MKEKKKAWMVEPLFIMWCLWREKNHCTSEETKMGGKNTRCIYCIAFTLKQDPLKSNYAVKHKVCIPFAHLNNDEVDVSHYADEKFAVH